MNLFELIKNKFYYMNLILVIFSFLMIGFASFAQDNVPDFPYDPEEKATEAKTCAKVCLRRRDVCIRREVDNSERNQICQSQMIICVNQCR
tara:strand:- start:10786 stop:11058 length:273 start_codon:yes stop_codon:yes gene_type:complete